MAVEMYRKGQGIYARGLSAASLGMVAFFGVGELNTLLKRIPSLRDPLKTVEIPFLGFTQAIHWAFLISAGAFGLCAAGIWMLMNHRKLVDFLVDTEDEMRKVAWPWDSTATGTYFWFLPNKGRELFNNSIVVIVSVFLMAMVLLVYDKSLEAFMRLVLSKAGA